MQIALLSDIHDNVWNLAAALRDLHSTDAMICCGDLCSPFVVGQLAEAFSGPIHIVFGNNDGDLYRITRIAASHPHVNLHGELFQAELGGLRISANHYPDIAGAIAHAGGWDVVCYGHNHVYQIDVVGDCLYINPGTLMGYNPIARQDIPATYVIFDTQNKKAQSFQVTRAAKNDREINKIIPYP